ncbi:hypothetical protein DV515_00000054, partial [Chloebia gouldiae]
IPPSAPRLNTHLCFTHTRVSVPAAFLSDWLRCQQGKAQAPVRVLHTRIMHSLRARATVPT